MAGNKKSNLANKELSFGLVSLTQKVIFARNLSVMLKSGLPITEALETAADSASGYLKTVIRNMARSVAAGRSLSEAMAEYPKIFSGLFVNIVRVGETSGTMVENLNNIALQLAREKEIISKVRGAMIYPIIVLVAAFGLGMLFSFVIMPKITPIFEGLNVDLPFSTRFLIWFSHLVEKSGFYLFGGIIGAAVFIIWLTRQKFVHPLTHFLLLKAPLIKNISKSVNLARFSRTIGTLIKSGMPIDAAIEITMETLSNYYYRQALFKASSNIRGGARLSSVLEEDASLFPVIVTKMIMVGEESGQYEEIFFYIADFYESSVDSYAKTLSVVIEPVLLLTIGVVVAFLALSIITPIYNITGSIGAK